MTMWQMWRRTVWALVLGGTLVLTASCSGAHISGKPFADPHLPGVTKVAGVELLEQQAHEHYLWGMTAYQPSDDPQHPHILFGVASVLYDVRLDGSTRSTHLACGDPITVTRDGRWAACNADSAGVALLDLTAETDTTSTLPILVASHNGAYVGDPTWAPDAEHLAVLSQRWGGCAIEIYAVSLERAHAALAVVLPLPQFVGHGPVGGYCVAHELTWSPDGTRFAFSAEPRPTSIYTLSLASVWPSLSRQAGAAGGSSYVNVTVTPDMLTLVTSNDSPTNLQWGPTAGRLTFTSHYGRTIEQIDLATRTKTTILTQNVTSITHLSWTPDGKHLVFELYAGESADYTPPPAQLYVYSPPS